MSRSSSDGPVYDLSDLSVAPLLKRRVTAAEVDLAITGSLSVGLFMSSGPTALLPSWVGSACAIGLALVGAVDVFTGGTAGRSAAGLRLRDARTGGAPNRFRVALRGVVRQSTVAVFVLGTSLTTRNPGAGVLVLFVAVTMAVVCFATCYITLFRTGRTVFDFAGGTDLAPRTT